MRKGQRFYSGDLSVDFWNRINKLPHNSLEGRELYGLGCDLQNLENRVLAALDDAERKMAEGQLSVFIELPLTPARKTGGAVKAVAKAHFKGRKRKK